MMTVFVGEEDSKRRIVLRNGVSLRYQKMGKMHTVARNQARCTIGATVSS